MRFIKMSIKNAIFTNVTILSKEDNSSTLPITWDNDTLFNCDFKTLYGGNPAAFDIGSINKVLLKRREYIGSSYTEWMTILSAPVNNLNDLIFAYKDYLTKDKNIYQYAVVEVSNSGVETTYYTTENVYSSFNDVIIASQNKSYKLTAGAVYNSYARNQEVGIYTTFGRKYPIGVSNALLSYDSMGIEGYLILDNKSGTVNRTLQTAYENEFKNFIMDKKPKIIKDFNGNLWVVLVNSNLDITPTQEMGNTIPKVNFSWVEIGNADDEEDLNACGLLPGKPIYS